LEQEASPAGFIPGTFSLQDVWLISTIGWTEARIPIAWRDRAKIKTIVQRHANRESVLKTSPPTWHPTS
jgi:hypothetical protein